MKIITAALITAMSATAVFAAPLTTTVDTTTVVNDSEISSSTLSQLTSAIQSFDTKEVKVKGQLFSYYSDTYIVRTEGGQEINVELDDGRSISNKAKACDTQPYGKQKPGNCNVSMTIEMEITNNDGVMYIKGVGYDVDLDILDKQ